MNKKETILNSAQKLFLKDGYVTTSIEKIAKDVGIGKGSVYTYFSSKEAILEEIVKSLAHEASKFVSETDFASHNDRVSFVSLLCYRYFLSHPDEFVLLTNSFYLNNSKRNGLQSPWYELDTAIWQKIGIERYSIEFARNLRVQLFTVLNDYQITRFETSTKQSQDILLELLLKYSNHSDRNHFNSGKMKFIPIYEWSIILLSTILICGTLVLGYYVYLFSIGMI